MLFIVGCSADASRAKNNEPAPQQPGVPVAVATVVQKAMPITTSVVGTAEAFSTVSVHAQVTGELTSVNFNDGEDVAKGQVLFTLDRRAFESALNQARANLQRDQAQAANAKSQTERYRGLVERGIATREQLDQISTTATALDATVAADRAAVENAEVQLTYTTIASPISGRTGKLMVHAGNLVRATDTTPLVVINQVAPIYVSFGIPEGDLPNFKRRMAGQTLQVEARPPNDDGPPSRGRVTFIDNAVDPATGTIQVRGTFPNEDRKLWPGQFVNVTVVLGTESEAVVVPTAAAQTGQQGPYVFVVKPDKSVELRSVQLARAVGQETVIRSGLKPGDVVVTDGQLRLVAGSHVSIRSAGSGEKTP